MANRVPLRSNLAFRRGHSGGHFLWRGAPSVPRTTTLLRHHFRTLDHRLRRGVYALNLFLHLVTSDELNFQSRLVGVLEKGPILERSLERLAQRGKSGGWNIGRCEEGASELLRREQKLEDLAILERLGEIGNEGHVRNLRMLLRRHLKQHVDFLLAQPVAFAQLHEGPAYGAKPLDLATLHGEQDFGRSRIAEHDLDLGAEQLVDGFGK